VFQYYFDLGTNILQRQLTASPVIAEISKRSNVESIAIQFVSAAVVIELDPAPASPAVGIFALKLPGNPNSSTFVLSAPSWVKSGTGVNTVYTFSLSMASAALDNLIAANPAGVSLDAEIQFTYPAGTYRSENRMLWTVTSEIIRGYETAVITPIYLDAIVALTGGSVVNGVPIDLDAIPLHTYPVGMLFQVVVGGVESTWKKVAGAAMTNIDQGVIRTLDYDAINNAFNLLRVGGL
jgi:hypothetical protein